MEAMHYIVVYRCGHAYVHEAAIGVADEVEDDACERCSETTQP